jgi:hypothetical protein
MGRLNGNDFEAIGTRHPDNIGQVVLGLRIIIRKVHPTSACRSGVGATITPVLTSRDQLLRLRGIALFDNTLHRRHGPHRLETRYLKTLGHLVSQRERARPYPVGASASSTVRSPNRFPAASRTPAHQALQRIDRLSAGTSP